MAQFRVTSNEDSFTAIGGRSCCIAHFLATRYLNLITAFNATRHSILATDF
jgi:hypothetical protein